MTDQTATPNTCRDYACNYGADYPEEEWILTDDGWVANPHFLGARGPRLGDTINKDRDELIFRGS